MGDNPLRKRANELRGQPGYKSRIDILIDSLGEDEKKDLLDLLQGEPLLPHAAVAAVLTENFEPIDGKNIYDRNVMDWRRSRGIRMKGRSSDNGTS